MANSSCFDHQLPMSEKERQLAARALEEMLERQQAALEGAKEANEPFTERDFGIPEISALIARMEAL